MSSAQGDVLIMAASTGSAGALTPEGTYIEGIDNAGNSSQAGTATKVSTGADTTPSMTRTGNVNRFVLTGFVVKHI